jgi:hypothetical protein
MPGLIGSQGVRPGALNMNRVFRALRYRTEQAQKVTYHRPTIYKTDNYGVPSGSVGSPEILLPDLPAIIRPAMTADYSQEKFGSNIIGAARVYTPNITTIKNLPNFNQDNNTNFNEIEGWDRLITNYRTIYSVPTSGTSGWGTGSATANWTFSSDGETLTATTGADYDGAFKFTTSATNTLEADRLRFKIKASGAVVLNAIRSFNGATQDNDYRLNYAPTSLTIPTGSWLTVDVPFISGTSATSIYLDGVRKAVTVTAGSNFDYEDDLRDFELRVSGSASGNKIYVRAIEYYKSVSWHVHSLKDMTDGYIIFNCVRTSGRYDSRRRAEE